MNKLSVLFLSSWYPNKTSGQNGNFVQQHARAVSLYCNVAVLHVQGKDQQDTIKITKVYNEGVYEVIVYYKKVSSNSLLSSYSKKQKQHKAFLVGYSEVLKEFKSIDLIHLNVVLPAGFFAEYLNKKFNIPYIVTEHSTVFLDSNPSNHNFIEKYFVKKITKRADYICPVSDDLKNAMVKYGIHGEFVVIPNVVNTKIFYLNKNKSSKKVNILHISTLVDRHKNIRGIINVIKKLSDIRKDFVFHVIGDGDVEKIREYANEVKLGKVFFNFQNKKPSEKIAEAMQSSHLFLMFSNYENSPCVISESLVSGIPIIATDVGGVKEMISKNNGILVKAKNETELLTAIKQLLDNLHEYDGEKISAAAKVKYSYENIGKQYLDLYRKAIDFE